ncbi:MAG: hypothetical protein JST54_01730 [Deltaproteobacteria bacterium]|nr:hypothetical protein [Deltaproteobacteria bacterium]
MDRAFLFSVSLAALFAAALGCTGSSSSTDAGSAGSTGGSGSSGGSSGSSATASCDPLAPKPITLGTIIGVGRDAQGTLYVDANAGLFISSNGTLYRQVVLGSGQMGNDEFDFNYAQADGGGAGALLVETASGTADAMALAPAGTRDFLGQPDAGVTPLQLVDASTVASMPVVNTPNVVEYLADISNGDILLSTLPLSADDSSTNGGRSIFYGSPAGAAQRSLLAFSQSRSGNGSLSFGLDGATATVQFAWTAPTDGGAAYTSVGSFNDGSGNTLTATVRVPVPATLDGLAFTCFAP